MSQLLLILNGYYDVPTRVIENVFGYRSFVTVTDELEELANNWISDIFPAIQAITCSDVVYTSVTVQDPSDPTAEFTATIPDGVGGISGDSLPPFNAWSFTYRRKNRTQRSGGKRFCGVAESSQVNGQPTGGMLTTLNSTAVTLATPVTVGLIQTWFPSIVHRGPAPTYTVTLHDISTVVFSRIGSQNTRKR